MARVRVALVGCGNIADRYATTMAAEGLTLVGATDVLPGRAAAFVAEYGGVEYPSLAALLAADEVDIVVNLTAPQAHAEVTAAALEAGKHVHSEKPLALRHGEAQALVELAAARGVALGCAPATLLGEAQQTAWKLLREGAVGRVRVAYAEANWGRIESWHPAPEPLLAVGALVDVGVYPLTILTAMFGPARRVTASAALVEPARVRLDGAAFSLETPDWITATLELADGTIARVTATFYVGAEQAARARAPRRRRIAVPRDVGRGRLPARAAGARWRVCGRPAPSRAVRGHPVRPRGRGSRGVGRRPSRSPRERAACGPRRRDPRRGPALVRGRSARRGLVELRPAAASRLGHVRNILDRR